MNTNRTRHGLKIAVLLAGAVASAGASALADQIVYFQNGKAIMVKSIEKGDKLTILEVEGGGKIGVPTSQIVRIEDYQITANEGVAAGGTPGLPQSAPVAAAPSLNAPAPVIGGTQPLNRPTGGGFDGTPVAASQVGRIPAPLPVGIPGQGNPADQPIRGRYPMSPLQGLARGGADGRMESPAAAGSGVGHQRTPFGLRHARGEDGRMAPGGAAQAPNAYQAAQAQAARMRDARPQAPPAPARPSEPAMDSDPPDTTADPDDAAADPEDPDADTSDDEPSVEN